MEPNCESIPSPPLASGLTQPRTRPRIPRQEWERQKEKIKHLYISDNKSLEDTMATMDREYGFYAKAYKDRLKQWKLEKNLKASHLKILVAKADKRAREDDKDTKLRFRGRKMNRERMDRFKKRRTTQEEELASPSASTPSGVSICTPSAGAPTPNATFLMEDVGDGASGGFFNDMELVVQMSPRPAGVPRTLRSSPRQEPFNVESQVFSFAQSSSNVDVATPPDVSYRALFAPSVPRTMGSLPRQEPFKVESQVFNFAQSPSHVDRERPLDVSYRALFTPALTLVAMFPSEGVIDVAPGGSSSPMDSDVQISPRAAAVPTTMGSLLPEERNNIRGRVSTFSSPLSDMDARLFQFPMSPQSNWNRYSIETVAAIPDEGRQVARRSEFGQAELLFLKAVQGSEHLGLSRRSNGIDAVTSLAVVHLLQGKLTEAESECGRLMAVCKELHGLSHVWTVLCLQSLALVYYAQRRYREGQSLLLQILPLLEKALGPSRVDAIHALANVYVERKDYTRSVTLYRRAIDRCRKLDQPGRMALCQFALGRTLHEWTNRLEEAKSLPLEASEYDRKVGIAQDGDRIGLDTGLLLQPDSWREIDPGRWIARKVEYFWHTPVVEWHLKGYMNGGGGRWQRR